MVEPFAVRARQVARILKCGSNVTDTIAQQLMLYLQTGTPTQITLAVGTYATCTYYLGAV